LKSRLLATAGHRRGGKCRFHRISHGNQRGRLVGQGENAASRNSSALDGVVLRNIRNPFGIKFGNRYGESQGDVPFFKSC
jgi:hypothetical protein